MASFRGRFRLEEAAGVEFSRHLPRWMDEVIVINGERNHIITPRNGLKHGFLLGFCFIPIVWSYNPAYNLVCHNESWAWGVKVG